MHSFSIPNLCKAIHSDNWPEILDSWRDDPEFQKLFGKTLSKSECSAWKPIKGIEQHVIDFEELSITKKLVVGSRGPLYFGEYQGEEVVIKMMWPSDSAKLQDEASTKSSLEDILREIAICSRLKHENIVRFVGACYNKPVYCLVMERVQGITLTEFLQRNKDPLPLETLFSIALDVARGMAYLHSKGVVHHDLKPGNLIVQEGSSKKVVKIIDFGASRLRYDLENDLSLKETGTYRWMAPEVMEHKKYNRRIDVYSFGMVLWQLVTGELPFSGMTPMQTVFAVVTRGSRPSIPESCPPRFASIIRRCWQSDPNARPEFWELVEILERYQKACLLSNGCRMHFGFRLKSFIQKPLFSRNLMSSGKIRSLSSSSLTEKVKFESD